jgi:ribosomal-protein-alanine N-acetyltransferase
MGKGLMSESIKLIKEFIFDELNLHRVEAACLPRNERSLKTLEKNNFCIEGLVRQYLKINGKWEDHLLLSCIKE